MLEKGIKLTRKSLKVHGYSSLDNASHLYYPGGMPALRRKLGAEEIARRPNAYWNEPANIEAEALKMIEGGTDLISNRMIKAGFGYLLSAINGKYQGGIQTLREKLGISYIRKGRDWWRDITNIENEGRKAFEAGIPLTGQGLGEAGLSGLYSAINKYYPGKIRGFREKLGLIDSQPQQISPDFADEFMRNLDKLE